MIISESMLLVISRLELLTNTSQNIGLVARTSQDIRSTFIVSDVKLILCFHKKKCKMFMLTV